MRPAWIELLSTPFSGDTPATLRAGDARTEAAAARDTTIVAPLAHLAAIRFAGEDTAAFLQGQLSSDVREAGPGRSQYSSYSTPKGRMLASFLLYQDADGHVMLLSEEIRDAIHKRLSMFIMRSKVKASVPDVALLGVAGPGAESLLASALGVVPQEDHTLLAFDGGHVIRVPQLGFIIAVAVERVAEVWQRLAAGATPVGPAAWQWREIHAGVVRVTGATQELFVPQMANLDLIGAVNFKKGCYPGQEIVARTQYLGKLKKRAYLARIEAPAVEPGQPLFSADFGEQASGQIANAALNGDGSYDALVVVQSSSLEHGVHFGAPQGPALSFLPLPYTV